MALLITKKFRCDVCLAEYGEQQHEIMTQLPELMVPTSKFNQLVYDGMSIDLCIMCMAPVHNAFKELLNRVRAEREGAKGPDGG